MITFFVFIIFTFQSSATELVLPSKNTSFEIRLLLAELNNGDYNKKQRIEIIKKFKLLNNNLQYLSKENRLYFSKIIFYQILLKNSFMIHNKSNTSLEEKINSLLNFKTSNNFNLWLKKSLISDYKKLKNNIYYPEIKATPFKNFYKQRQKQILYKKIKYLLPLYQNLIKDKLNSKIMIYQITLKYLDKLNSKLKLFINSDYSNFKQHHFFYFPKVKVLKQKKRMGIEALTQSSIDEINKLPKATNDWELLDSDFNPVVNKLIENNIKKEFNRTDRLPEPVEDWILD